MFRLPKSSFGEPKIRQMFKSRNVVLNLDEFAEMANRPSLTPSCRRLFAEHNLVSHVFCTSHSDGRQNILPKRRFGTPNEPLIGQFEHLFKDVSCNTIRIDSGLDY